MYIMLHNSQLSRNNTQWAINTCSQWGQLPASVMVKQPIIQAVISSVETFDGTKSKIESWIASVENEAQISGKDILCITF